MTQTKATSSDREPVAGSDNGSTARDLWVFGYGSLMWRPGFPYVERCPVVLVGYRRAFCVYSTHHRGTAERPGLVLGLDRGGACHGLAFRIAPQDRAAVLDYLRAREQINGVYRETLLSLEVSDRDGTTGSQMVNGIAYVVERAHPSYSGALPIAEQARLIRGAAGLSGPNIDYLANTLIRAEALGLDARDLRRIMTMAGSFFGNRPPRPYRGERPPDTAPDVRPAALALVTCCRTRRNGPRQPSLGERRRFRFRINREKAVNPGA